MAGGDALCRVDDGIFECELIVIVVVVVGLV
jgi:hypothetical protein